MNAVFEKTRELGQALLESEIYQKMKACEDKAMKNEAASGIMSEYLETRSKLQEMLSQPDPDSTLMKQLSDRMDECQAQLQNIPDITELTSAREAFNELIGQVNQVLQFIVTGQIDEPEGGCTGSCSTCGGSCHLN